MAGDNEKVVWVLGAGFSRPLGTPLFRELISRRTLNAIQAWPEYNAQPNGSGPSASLLAEAICRLYLWGSGSADGAWFDDGRLRHAPRAPGFQLWEDAEQFLEATDIARSDGGFLANSIKDAINQIRREIALQMVVLNDDPPSMSALEHLRGSLDAVHREAVRYVAGACSVFLRREEADSRIVSDSERWDPYRLWLEQLRPHDSILTFNYDRVLNLLDKAGGSVNLAFCPPDPDTAHAQLNTRTCVYHLHGHVGWSKAQPAETATTPTAHMDPDNAVLGVPGELKRTMPSGSLKEIWTRAKGAIVQADAIVFVGYRFPETDSHAKRELLSALKARPKARIHVVLGTNNPDRPRLEQMLRWTREQARVDQLFKPHEMWAQDFFSLFERGRL